MKTRIMTVSILVLAAMFLYPFPIETPVAASGGLTGEKVCIDPGHGGEDSGASPSGEQHLQWK